MGCWMLGCWWTWLARGCLHSRRRNAPSGLCTPPCEGGPSPAFPCAYLPSPWPSPDTSHCPGEGVLRPQFTHLKNERVGPMTFETRCACWLPTLPGRPTGQSSPPPSTILPLMQVGKNVSACAGRRNHIRSLEHVQVQLSLSYSRRGDLEISLTSPMGTHSTLVAIRYALGEATSTSVHCWGWLIRTLWTNAVLLSVLHEGAVQLQVEPATHIWD
jgi:hypothetical protein